jgi:hypothetical protein
MNYKHHRSYLFKARKDRERFVPVNRTRQNTDHAPLIFASLSFNERRSTEEELLGGLEDGKTVSTT